MSRYMSYDPWNRLEEVNDYGAVESYGYSPDGQRVYKATPGEDPVFYFRGAGGEMMAEYGLETWTDTGFTVDAAVRYRSFGGKLLGMETGASTYKVLQMDRKGSVVGDGADARYLRPYGEAHWAPEVKITFNTYSAGTYWNDNLYNATELLLHELGHAMRFIGFRGGGFVHNDDEYSVGMANFGLVRKNCLDP